VSRSYDLFSPGHAVDLSVALDGIQIMLDGDIRNGVVDKKFTLDRVINDRILKQAQQELKNEARLKPLIFWSVFDITPGAFLKRII
jgi:hypothetical protein